MAFCSHPFNKLHISVSGDAFVCCSAWLDLPIGNAFTESFDRIWNSENAVLIRKSILDGSFRHCDGSKCPRIISGYVEREEDRGNFEEIISSQATFMEKGPGLLSLNYDYSCNLYCKSCRETKKVMGKERRQELMKFQETLLGSPLLKGVRRLTVSGAGEVFASAVLMDLLGRIREEEYPQLKITLRTNGLLLTPRNWERVRNVHYAIDVVSVSIDAATEETYSKLRRGGDFGRLLENMAFLRDIKKNRGIQVRWHFVVQRGNFREMPEFVRLATRYGCDKVAFAKLFNLGTFSEEGYRQAAIFEPGNPEYDELRSVLRDPALRHPSVRFKNLANLAGE